MKLQKIGVLLMVIVMTLCAGLTVSAKDVSDYNDVHENDWHYSYVKDVSEQGLMTGLNATTFGPSQKLARSQFATIIYRMYGSPQTSYKALFNDVTDGNFYSVPVTWASQFGVITGYTDGSGNFGPADDITREQLATMLYRYADKLGYDLSVSETANNFPDKNSVSVFALDGMNWCISKGIITGDQGKINPQGTVNRAVCATMISRFNGNGNSNGSSSGDGGNNNNITTPSEPSSECSHKNRTFYAEYVNVRGLYKCQKCHAYFSDVNDLSQHKVDYFDEGHTGNTTERVYDGYYWIEKCTDCGKEFSREYIEKTWGIVVDEGLPTEEHI